MRPIGTLGGRWWRVGAVVAVLVASVAVAAQPASANIVPPNAVKDGTAYAGGCWDDGCNYYYYNYGGPHCTDAYVKSARVGTGLYGIPYGWWVEVRYSPACGAAFAYVRNFWEPYGAHCEVQTYFTFNGGYSWHYHHVEPVDAGYTFAYTTMRGDAGPYDKVRGRVYCWWNDGFQNWSDWAHEI